MSRKKYLLLLFLAWISPILCGLLWGKIALLIYTLLLSVLLVKSLQRKWLNYLLYSLIFLSVVDIMLNLFNRYRVNQQTLFVETEIPLVHKYKANSTLNVDYIDGELGSNAKKYPLQIRIDNLGYRNNKHTQDSCDVLLLGDSFGVGNAEQDSIISELMYSDHHLNTYNLSVSGNGPWEQHLLLTQDLSKVKLKKGATVVWLLFAGNDLEGNFYPLGEEEELNSFRYRWSRFRDDYFTFRSQSPLRNLSAVVTNQSSDRVEAKNSEMKFYAPYIKESKDWLCCDCDVSFHKNITLFKNTLACTIKYLQDRDLNVHIYLLPSKEEVYGGLLEGGSPWVINDFESPLSRVIREIAQTNNVEYLDLKSALMVSSAEHKTFYYWNYDTHLNHKGNKLISDIISERVLNR